MKTTMTIDNMSKAETLDELDQFFALDFRRGTLKRYGDGIKCIARFSFNPGLLCLHAVLAVCTFGVWLVPMAIMELSGYHTRKYVRVWLLAEDDTLTATLRGTPSWVQTTQARLRREGVVKHVS